MNRRFESSSGEQDWGKLSHSEVVGHLHPEESVSRIEALERELAETRESKARQEEVARGLKDELEKQ